MKKINNCYIKIDEKWHSIPLCYAIDDFKYRIFFLQCIFNEEYFYKLYKLSSDKKFTIKINNELIQVISRQRAFLESIPGQYFCTLHLQELIPDNEVFFDPKDIHLDSIFFCEIGKIFVRLSILVEPLPGQEPMCSHYHVMVLCPRKKIVEAPELDKCSVTQLTCHFNESLSTKYADKQSRMKEYGMRIIQLCTHIDNAAKKKLINYYNRRKLISKISKIEKMSLNQKFLKLLTLNVINEDLFQSLTNVRKVRNKIAHEAKPEHTLYKFKEEELIDIIKKAEYCLWMLNK